MKALELREKTTSDLQSLLVEKRAELHEKHRSNHAGELANPKSIKEVRRDIALILTVLNEQKSIAVKEEA